MSTDGSDLMPKLQSVICIPTGWDLDPPLGDPSHGSAGMAGVSVNTVDVVGFASLAKPNADALRAPPVQVGAGRARDGHTANTAAGRSGIVGSGLLFAGGKYGMGTAPSVGCGEGPRLGSSETVRSVTADQRLKPTNRLAHWWPCKPFGNQWPGTGVGPSEVGAVRRPPGVAGDPECRRHTEFHQRRSPGRRSSRAAERGQDRESAPSDDRAGAGVSAQSAGRFLASDPPTQDPGRCNRAESASCRSRRP